jgi:hypothetical protein
MGELDTSADATSGSTTADLTALTYRSRAVKPLFEPELREMERQAQARNRALGLTGFAVYDDGRFFQWLEGPAEALGRVWNSVRRDPRHTDIKELCILPTPSRLFTGWDMNLSIRGPEDAGAPIAAPSLLAALAIRGEKEPGTPLLSLVPSFIDAVVVPGLVSSRGTVRRFLPRVSPAASRLARLLLADDPQPAANLLGKLYARAGALGPLCATVIEPATRNLGDLWSTDDCSQFALTLALCRLESNVRRLSQDATQVDIGLPAVLVAPQPGEAHLLGASLDADLLWQAGWDTHREFPDTDRALQTLLADTWFDVLDLSLSPALGREASLPLMAETIAGARLASRNPALTVVVGGRAFFDQPEGTSSVGADASTSSALQIVLAVTNALQKTLTAQAERSLSLTSS